MRLDEKLDAMLTRRLSGDCPPRERAAVALINEDARDGSVVYWIETKRGRRESKTRFFLVDFLIRNNYV
jgi:hypothetical protein